MNRRKLLSGFFALSGIAVAFVGGYLAARNSPSDWQSRSKGVQQVPRMGAESSAGQNEGREAVGGQSWSDAKGRLMKSWMASPAAGVDFELREETHRFLATVSNEDLAAWLRELPKDGGGEPGMDNMYRLHDFVLMVLAPRAGGDLIRSLAEHPVDGQKDDVSEAMDLWIKHDPSAVLAWVDGNVPDGIKDDIDDYRDDALVELSGKDPIEFEERLARLDQETRESVLEWYARWKGNPEWRPVILARAMRSPHGEAMALWKGLIRGGGADDLQRAETTLQEVDVSDSDRAALDEELVSSLLSDYYTSGEDRSEIMQGWVVRNSGGLVPQRVLNSFEYWSRQQLDQVVAWVSSQSPGPQFDTFARSLVREWAAEKGLDHPAAANMAARISDPDLRGEAQKKLKKSWQAKDAAAATQWEESLPAADRERLK